MNRTPLAAGLDAAFRHLRLALSLWLFLLGTALLAWPPLRAAFEPLDQSPFRETLLKGWDPWGAAAFLATKGESFAVGMSVLGGVLLLGALLHVFLTGGLLRVLIADVERPVMRRLVAESAGLFRQNLWATVRFLVQLLIWEGVVVGIPVALLGKVAGENAPPNGPLSTIAFWWGLVAGAVVFLNVLLRLDLARVALARGDAPTARAAWRVSKQRISGQRASAVGLGLFWLLACFACQVLFTRIGTAMNPGTAAGMSALVLVRQLGFLALMMLRVGWWASLLQWEKLRRPAAMPVAHVPAAAPAVAEAAIG